MEFTFIANKEFINLSTQIPPDGAIYEELGEEGSIELKETNIHYEPSTYNTNGKTGQMLLAFQDSTAYPENPNLNTEYFRSRKHNSPVLNSTANLNPFLMSDIP